MEVQPISEQIQALCAKIAVAQGAELSELTAELRRLLTLHSRQVRNLIAHTWIASPRDNSGQSNGT